MNRSDIRISELYCVLENNCVNGGVCVEGEDSALCNCQQGFAGNLCENGQLINLCPPITFAFFPCYRFWFKSWLLFEVGKFVTAGWCLIVFNVKS